MRNNYKLIEDIPVFTNDRYWGEIEESQMRDLLKKIEESGFEAAKKSIFQADQKFYEFIFGEVRSDWRFCLPIKKEWKVLDIGAGLGANSFALAKEVAEVRSMDSSFLRAKFIKLRKEFENQQNLEMLVGDALDLPFEDQLFDLVVANGLFEWLGVTDKFDSPPEAQKHFLKEARRVLKPGGWLYIGIENRFAATYLFGGVDHSGLRYTSWMPRVFANFYTKLRTGKRYKTYTYSKYGYEKMIKRAGFSNIQTYLVLPGYNVPKYIVAWEHLAGLKYLTTKILGGQNFRKKTLKFIIKFPLVDRLWRFLYFSFAIFGQKQ